MSKNIIITNLSILGTNPQKHKYQAFDGVEVYGVNTNDAPVEYLIEHIESQGESVGKILAITTTEALTSYDAFCETISGFAAERGFSVPKPQKIDTSDSEIHKTIQEIINEIDSDDKIYIDTTGSFRKSSYLLMGVVRVLEFSDIMLELAVYSNFDRNATLQHIEDVTYLYKMFDLINAVNTFTSIGNSSELDKYFHNCENQVVKDTITAMNAFSDEMTLCRTSNLDEVLNKLNICLDNLSKDNSTDRDIVLFRNLIETIKKKFRFIDGKIEYPSVVQWCIDNNLIQQAVTIYVEKMPEYIYKKGYFTATQNCLSNFEQEIQNKKGHVEYYSCLLYEKLMTEISSIVFLKALVKSDMSIKRFVDIKNDTELKSFIRGFPKISCMKTGDYENELRTMLKVKNAIYNPVQKTVRKQEDISEKLKDMPEVAELVQNGGIDIGDTMEKFLKKLVNNEKVLKIVLNIKSICSDNHIDFVESIGNDFKSDGFKLTDKLSAEQLREIFRDIYYMKKFIRNKLNHASEEEVSEELCEYFEKFGYNVDEPDVEYIKKFITEAIKKFTL